MKSEKRSPTDHMDPIYTGDQSPPFGFDICGRRVLHRDGRPGYPSHVIKIERDLFRQCMARYRARTGLNLNVTIWSFAEIDTAPLSDRLTELRKIQMSDEKFKRLENRDG